MISSLFFKTEEDDIVYIRNIEQLLFWPHKNKNVFFEIHFWSKKDRILSFLIKKARGVIVVTQRQKRDLVEMGLSDSRVLVAPDAVDLRDFNIREDKTACRRRFNLPEDKQIILYAGHLYKWKGANVLARAAEHLNDCLIVFVGGTEKDVSSFNEKYKAANILIVGHRPHEEMALWMKAADVLILPNSKKESISSYYTSPIKMFEYMASCRPIVASDLPSIREILNEENAVLVEPDNELSLAEGIKRVLSDQNLGRSIARRSFEDVQKYTWSKRARRILDFINENVG